MIWDGKGELKRVWTSQYAKNIDQKGLFLSMEEKLSSGLNSGTFRWLVKEEKQCKSWLRCWKNLLLPQRSSNVNVCGEVTSAKMKLKLTLEFHFSWQSILSIFNVNSFFWGTSVDKWTQYSTILFSLPFLPPKNLESGVLFSHIHGFRYLLSQTGLQNGNLTDKEACLYFHVVSTWKAFRQQS